MIEIFEKNYLVPASDENVMKHVDNQIYLRWMNEVAIDHSTAVGWGIEDYLRIGSAFVARSHFIEYLAPTFAGDELLFVSWISDLQKNRSTRQYQFFKLPDYQLFLRGETKWVYLNIDKGRPMTIPNEVKESFHAIPDTQVEMRLSEIKKGLE